ncbi:helix-turn-helix domain-containing protein [Caldicellulosiruptoraceae bacterium PP1]
MEICDIYSNGISKYGLAPVVLCYYYRYYKNGFYMEPHKHKRAEIMYVTKGHCKVNIQNECVKLENGDFILINGEIEHQLLVDINLPCKVLCLEFAFMKEQNHNIININYQHYLTPEFLNHSKQYIVLKDSDEVYLAIKGILSELERINRNQNLINLMFTELMIKISRLYSEIIEGQKDIKNFYVDTIKKFIEHNYYKEIKISDLASIVNLNPTYLEKIFKKNTGSTPIDYLIKVRIEKAKMFLVNTDIPVTEICNYVGINSRQYFSLLFKKLTGYSPQQYRLTNSINRYI